MRHRLMALALALLLALLAAACGNDDDTAEVLAGDGEPTEADDGGGGGGEDGDGTDGEGGFPVSVDADNGAVEISERPERIVSLSGSATEILFAIGAGDQVHAVDEYSYYPPEAPVTDLSGFQPNVEAITEYDPDLVVLAYAADDVIESLELLDIPVVHLDAPPDFDGIYRQVELLGAATGNIGEAAELVSQMQADIDEIVGGLPEHAEGLTYFHELDDTYFTLTSDTFIGRVYALLGLENIADAADPDAGSGGYLQLSEEFIIEADPDIIFLADAACCGQSFETVSARPGWEGLTAVTTGAVVEVDEDIASRWGPRIIDYLRDAADAVSALEPAS